MQCKLSFECIILSALKMKYNQVSKQNISATVSLYEFTRPFILDKPPEKRACSESESIDSTSSESVHSSRSQGEGCKRLKSPATVSHPISPMPADSQKGKDGTMVVDLARSPRGASSCDAAVEADAAIKNINYELCNGIKQSAVDKATALEVCTAIAVSYLIIKWMFVCTRVFMSFVVAFCLAPN